MGKTFTGSSAAAWDDIQMQALRQLFDAGLSDSEIGAKLTPPRTCASVTNMRRVMGLDVINRDRDRWDGHEAADLERLFFGGETDAAIAAALGRTVSSVASYRRRRGLVRENGGTGGAPKATAGKKTRACMCCRIPFLSEGAHNRLCDPCRDGAESAYGYHAYAA